MCVLMTGIDFRHVHVLMFFIQLQVNLNNIKQKSRAYRCDQSKVT